MSDEDQIPDPAFPSADGPAGGLADDDAPQVQPEPEPEPDDRPTNPWSAPPEEPEPLEEAAVPAPPASMQADIAVDDASHKADIVLDDVSYKADIETAPASAAGDDLAADPVAIDGDSETRTSAKIANPRRVRTVDFRRPTKFTRDQMRRLEGAHDGFCRGASTRLSAELRTGVEVVVTTSDQLSYAAVMNELPEEAIVTILDVDPIDTQVALIFELPLAVNLIDRLLGAVIARKTMPTGLTDLEAVVLQRVIRSIVEPLSATWHELAGVRFSIAVAASTPANAQFAAPSEPCLLLGGEAHLDGASSPIVFCLPHASVEPLMERLEKAHVRNRTIDERATEMLRQAVSNVDVELRAEVGAVEMDMAGVLALRPGDLLPLRSAAGDGVTVLAGDVPSYMAAPGRNNAARAVQISGPYREGPQ